ncbi:recombinase family protein [Pseudoalteromonas sp. JC3]|uniref:recombinase family protein n=1 Tax=Pseudoalteromonas sp. JC3 TaxID=2810196 RepID=UPI0019D193D7|nr:recombinase family protein [Pseudoalteromonas sp. JC3]MBR8841687.1 recombinase family protein [Pseudoalteromonas sp. JC3]WJE07711.1 recombinase family protein [Pseudoalteromonas sp. JC3]
MMKCFLYMRVSTVQQKLDRQEQTLLNYAKENNLTVSDRYYYEKESGSKLERPQLMALLEFANKRDAILVEQVDRLSRLNDDDWTTLKAIIKKKELIILSPELPAITKMIDKDNKILSMIGEFLSELVLELLVTTARKDLEDRKRRCNEGRKIAIQNGVKMGRPVDTKLHENIASLLNDGVSWTRIQQLLNCSRSTIQKVSKTMKEEG